MSNIFSAPREYHVFGLVVQRLAVAPNPLISVDLKERYLS